MKGMNVEDLSKKTIRELTLFLSRHPANGLESKLIFLTGAS